MLGAHLALRCHLGIFRHFANNLKSHERNERIPKRVRTCSVFPRILSPMLTLVVEPGASPDVVSLKDTSGRSRAASRGQLLRRMRLQSNIPSLPPGTEPMLLFSVWVTRLPGPCLIVSVVLD